MAKKQTKPRSPEEIEKRRAVRFYAAPLLAGMLKKERGSGLPPEKTRRILAIGCIRWGLMAVEQEDRLCSQEDDAESRQAFQEEEAAA